VVAMVAGTVVAMVAGRVSRSGEQGSNSDIVAGRVRATDVG
jgi:hypothetical protein